ncbi:hypothetical protein [Cerasicoccus frondis]|uniref:hypothetical protein n=1 Tax=Cerasicoccus frondis TaxID=490090 RepID=UPI002852B221|nr:hypothetical protein [Cerasicoccus frondis]
MLEKARVVSALIEKLEAELTAADHASRDAAAYATSEESRAESKWDTQGLEASYLAAGQAGQAKQLASALGMIKGQASELARPCTSIQRGALFNCKLGRTTEWFFFAPSGGGETLHVDETEITVITADSPLAHRLLGLSSGNDFSLPNGAPGQVLTVK